ncbi:MAG TPA: hypothetical protein VK695_05370 [Steroidobacteraceae bacterium]|nr:hypothetical protein [Steroidobacteraceae bacterium]
MSTKVGLPVKIFAGVMMGGLIAFIGLAVMQDDKPKPLAQSASQATSKPVVQPVKSAASKWGCKANDAECASSAEKAEAEYQAKGGDSHERAEEEAFSKPEALAANEYFEKFMTAKKSGATQGELCHLLQVAHLGYVEAGATDEASNMHDWQVQLRCGS